MPEHELWQIGYFTHRTSHFENGLPVRVPLDPPYYRYYCTCGSIGGKRSTNEAARLAFERHVEEAKSHA